MSPKVKILYDAALSDLEFNEEADLFDNTFKKPGVFTSSMDKHIYAIMYWGWLCGKGKSPIVQV